MGSNAVSDAVRTASRPLGWRRTKQKRFLIAGIVVLLAIGYLIYAAVQSTMMLALTVSQLRDMGATVYGEQLRVSGRVVEGSIKADSKNLVLAFRVTDDRQELPVVYRGVVPDAFKAGADVVLEGKYTPEGVFEANDLLAKCPSKYIPGT